VAATSLQWHRIRLCSPIEVVAQRLMIFDRAPAESFAFVKFRDAVRLVNRERIEDERNPDAKGVFGWRPQPVLRQVGRFDFGIVRAGGYFMIPN
jgi:hypothetical protein